MPKHRSRMFVLRKPLAQQELVAFARVHGWSLVGEQSSAAARTRVTVMGTVLPGLSVLYWEFDEPRLCAVTVDSTLGPETIEPFATLVQATLVPFMLTELLDEIDNEADRVLGLWRAGYGAPGEADPAFLSRFSSAAADPDPAVRTAAVMAMCQTGWPECGLVVAEVARADGDRAVRKMAKRVERALPRMRPEGGPVRVTIPDLYPDGAAHLYPVAMKALADAIDSSRLSE